MALPQAINFRETIGYVSDGENQHAELTQSALNYPTLTSQNNNVGWSVGGSYAARNRSNTNPAHLAGVHYATKNVNAEYRIDLPSPGVHIIRLAAGDAVAAARMHIQIMDNTTMLTEIGPLTTGGANHFIDASGVNHTSPANWDENNSSIELTFSTTVLILRFPAGPAESNRVISHFYINSAGFLPAWVVNSNRVIA